MMHSPLAFAEEHAVKRPEVPDAVIRAVTAKYPQGEMKRFIREVEHGLAFCLSLPLDYPGGNKLFQHRKEPKFFHEGRAEGGN